MKFFSTKFVIFFLFLPKALIVGTSVSSNEYSQSVFWCKNKKNRCTPAIPQFYNINVGWVYSIHAKILMPRSTQIYILGMPSFAILYDIIILGVDLISKDGRKSKLQLRVWLHQRQRR